MDNTEAKTFLQFINKKQFILEEHHDVVLDVLSRTEHQNILNSVGDFRARLYTPLKTLSTYIHQVLSADKSSHNAVAGINVDRLIAKKNPVCPNTGSYTKAKKRLKEETIYELVKSVCSSLLKKVPMEWAIYGRDVKVFDGTTLTLADTQANNKQYPKHSNQKQSVGFPQLRLLAVFSLLTGHVVDYALDATKGKGTGEVTLLRSILGCIQEEDIVIGDALFCNFFLMHEFMNKKVDVIVPGHVQRRYDFNEGEVLGNHDHITQWTKPRRPKWMSKEEYKTYPNAIKIREFKVNGIVYMTTFMNPSIYPKNELHKLYKRRWEAELHLRSLKTYMKMDRLVGTTPEMVRKEIGVHLLAYNIIRELMVDGCIQGDALPTQISFKGTLQILNQFSPHFLSITKAKKATLYRQMLALIVKNKVGLRPGRVEPRAIRKKESHFPILKNRDAEKEKLLDSRKEYLIENKAA